MSEPISVILADDHGLMRGTLATWLDSFSGLEVVGSVADAYQALVRAIELQPDIVVLDVDMPGLNSFEAARMIRTRCPNTRVVFLSAFFNDRYIDSALEAEASGYVVKGEPAEAVVQAIRTVACGAAYFSPEVQSRLVIDEKGTRLISVDQSGVSTLTQRELEMLRYLARGLAKKEIAGITRLSVRTVERHIANVMTKLAIHDRVELARFAIREGLAEP